MSTWQKSASVFTQHKHLKNNNSLVSALILFYRPLACRMKPLIPSRDWLNLNAFQDKLHEKESIIICDLMKLMLTFQNQCEYSGCHVWQLVQSTAHSVTAGDPQMVVVGSYIVTKICILAHVEFRFHYPRHI